MDKQYALFQSWIENNTLLYVEMLIRKVGRKTVFGRLISVNEKEESILLYDVDNKKQVLSIKINEIDHIEPSCHY